MKRASGLFSKIIEKENLLLAFWKAQRGKQDKEDVHRFRLNLHGEIDSLQQQLKTGKTILGHYHYFTVRDPKERRICAASFPERVLHHAIMNVCDPVFESYAIYDTYACRKGKGLHKAIQRAQSYAKNYSWCLKLDIARYYDNIDHSLLLGFLNRRFKEKALLELFERILATYETFPQKGLPIGNLTSQHRIPLKSPLVFSGYLLLYNPDKFFRMNIPNSDSLSR